jgi:DNA polymerase-3 subunit alpha
MGIEVLPPNINEGHLTFQVASEGRIHFGLGAIKGVGFKAVEAIIKAREEGGPYHSLDDFFERVPTKEVGAGCVETLVHAGAFDGLGARRAQLLAVLPRALQAGQAKQEDKKRGQLGLFDVFEHHGSGAKGNGNGHANGNGKAHPPAMNLPDVPELSDAEKLALEKKALGFYMSSHPLARYAGELQALATHRVADLPGVPEKVELVLGGMISGIQIKSVQKSRSGLTRMAKLTFEDLSGSTPAMLWPEEFAKMEALVKSDQVVFVRGALDRRRDPPELIVSRIIPLEQGRAELTRGVVVRLHKGVHQAEHLERLLRAIRVRPGNLDLYLEVMGLEQVRRVIYRAAPSLRVRYDERLCTDLENAVGAGLVRLLGHRGATTRIDSGTPATETPTHRTPAPSLMAAPADLETDDDSHEDLDD